MKTARRENTSRRLKVKWSLSLTVVLGLVFLVSIPVSVMGIATFFRSRQLLLEQTTNQVQSIFHNQSQELAQISSTSQDYFDKLTKDQVIITALRDLMRDPTNENLRNQSGNQLRNYINRQLLFGLKGADQISILDADGRVLISTEAKLNGKNLGNIPQIKKMLGVDITTTIYNVADLYPDQFSIFSSRVVKSERANSPSATLLLSTSPTNLKQIISSLSSVFDQSTGHFITEKGESIGFASDTQENLTILEGHTEHYQSIVSVFSTIEKEGATQYTTKEHGAVLAYAKWFSDLNTGLVLEIPNSITYQQINNLIPFSVILITVSVLIAALLAFLGSQFLTRPLIKLSAAANRFANGDWSERAEVNRNDEIGVLAKSFNYMVEQISDLYQSMENRVEQRSQQIRIASEIGQVATTSANRDEIAQKTTHLVLERFGFPYAAIAFIDESGANAVIAASESTSQSEHFQIGTRISVESDTVLGWVARHNQTRLIIDAENNSMFSINLMQSDAHSEISMPIAIGSRVFGVFDVQSAQTNGFDNETISVLQTLCNQVANALQNMRLLEATQINLEETTLLYRASRQLTRTENDDELTKTLMDTLGKTSHVAALFKVHPDHINLVSLVDPRSQLSTQTLQGVKMPLRNLPMAFSKSSILILDDLSKSTEYENLLSFFIRRSCQTAAVFPIFVGESLSRIVVLGSRDPLSLTETGLQPYANLFEVFTSTLERFNIHTTLQSRVNELQTITQVSQAISAETDVYQLYHILHQKVMQVMGSDVGFLVANYSSKDNLVRFPYIYENGELLSIEPFPLGEGLTSHLIKTRQPLMMVKDTEKITQQLGAKIIGRTAKSWLGVPLVLGNEVLGAIVLQDTEQEERFTEADLTLFRTLAPQIAISIRNAQLLTEMQQALHAYDQERFLLSKLLEAIPEQVFFKDVDGHYLRISHSYAAALGLQSPEQAMNLDDSQILDPLEADRAKVELVDILASGVPVERTEKSLHEGQMQWHKISRIPLLNQEKLPSGLLGINRDVTELKKAEEIAQHRALHLQIAQEIARDTSGTLEIDRLLRNATQMIRDRFDFYHASIFIIDHLGEYAELKESTGEVGEKMKELRHRLAVGSQSLVGQATATGEPVIINDVSNFEYYYANPLLPDTRSELVIPLKSGGKIIGAMDVQSTQLQAFSDEDVNILSILADQLAIAILNATLFTNSQQFLSQHRMLHQITLGASSTGDVFEAMGQTIKFLQEKRGEDRIAVYLVQPNKMLELQAEAGFETTQQPPYSIQIGQGMIGQTAQENRILRIDNTLAASGEETISLHTRSKLALPVTFGNQIIGALYIENPRPGAFSENDEEIFASLANTLGSIISNARLVEAVQSQVERQRQIIEVTNRIRQSLDIKTILEVSAAEISKAVGAHRARINLTLDEIEPDAGSPLSRSFLEDKK